MELQATGLFEFIDIQLETIPKHIFMPVLILFKCVLYHPVTLLCHQSLALTPPAALCSSSQMHLPISGEHDCIPITYCDLLISFDMHLHSVRT